MPDRFSSIAEAVREAAKAATPDMELPLKARLRFRDVIRSFVPHLKPEMITFSDAHNHFGRDSAGFIDSLLGLCLSLGSDKPARDIVTILLENNTAARVVIPLWGGSVERVEPLHDGYELWPMEKLRDSYRIAQAENAWSAGPMEGGFLPGGGWFKPTCAIVRPLPATPILTPAPDTTKPERLEVIPWTRDSVALLSATSGRTMQFMAAWNEYGIPVLDTLAFSGCTIQHPPVVPMMIISDAAIDVDRARSLMTALEQVPPTPRRRIRTSLHRVHRALSYRVPSDFAVELCIALESLLATGHGENAHKCATRCALLAGATAEERWRIREVIRAVYGIRNAVMHEGKEKGKLSITESPGAKSKSPIAVGKALYECAEYCVRAAEALATQGGEVRLEVLDLEGRLPEHAQDS